MEEFFNEHKKAEYGHKVIKTVSAGFPILVLDYCNRTIIIPFPDGWEEMTTEEQLLWIRERIKQ
jgi:hypothetical protein